MTETKSKGRKPQYRTIEDIDEKLTEKAKPFLWASNQEAYEDLVLNKRVRLLADYCIASNQKERIPHLIFIEHNDPAFENLPDTVKEQYFQIEKDFREKYLGSAFLRKTFSDASQEELQNVYRQITLINCFYEWMMTPPAQGGRNYYSVLREIACKSSSYFEFVMEFLSRIFSDLVKNNTLPATRTQKQAYELLNKNFAELITQTIAEMLTACYRHGGAADAEEIERMSTVEGCRNEVITRLKAVTLKELRHKLKYTGTMKDAAPNLFNSIHSPFVEEFAKLSECDGHSNPFTAASKRYESEKSDIILDVIHNDAIKKKNPTKDVFTDKVLRTTIRRGFALGDTFKQDGVLLVPKAQFMRFLGYTDEEIENPTTRKNFFSAVREQLDLLNRTGFTTKSKDGSLGSGAHVVDAYNIGNSAVYIRIGKEFLYLVQHYRRIGWNKGMTRTNAIPNRCRVEYYLQLALERDFSSKHTMVQGRETLKMKTIISRLEEYGIISTNTRKYKEKVYDRIIAALDYLQKEKYIEYYFVMDDNATPMTPEELQRCTTKGRFEQLRLWYIVPELEATREEEAPIAIEAAQKKKEKKEKRQKAQEAATDRTIGELIGKSIAEKLLDQQKEKTY